MKNSLGYEIVLETENNADQFDRELAAKIDHTLLDPEATEKDVEKICNEAKKYGFASVCVNTHNLEKVVQMLKGTAIKPIAVIGFPFGASSTDSKVFEARDAIRTGALEIDMVINLGLLKDKHYDLVLKDIKYVVEACFGVPTKVIIEAGSLTEEEKVVACCLSKLAGASFVKTSTGFGKGGAIPEDVALMKRVVGLGIEVKASGGIKTREQALELLRAGATRLGTSSSLNIIKIYDKVLKK
jgi:deoxyribose-phosphate aldolase